MTIELVPGKGFATPRGAHVVGGGVNFSVYSETAEIIWVCLFNADDREIGRFALEAAHGNVHCGLIRGIALGQRYGLRADGPYDPAQGLYFDPDKLLIDPYARVLDRAFVRDSRLCATRGAGTDTADFVPKAIVSQDDFKAAAPLRDDVPQLVYELNVRGFTKLHPEVPEAVRGTVEGLMAPSVLAHFKKLGVDVVELMPVAGWIDEGHLLPLGLTNAWGYNPVNYFAPDLRLMPGGIGQLRAMTDLYRTHGMRVILDVVYNHTGESDLAGPVISMKGLDARTYYRYAHVDGRLELVNDTGTGNTLHCDHPEVQRLVIDSLRYWVEAGGVSGFRFDLAPVLGRGDHGFRPDAEMLELIRSDGLLGRCLLVAEPWDPGPGGYHLGQFGPGFCEWNDKYRDDVRAFWRGESYALPRLAHALAGSSDVFADRSPNAGFNFLAVHDGFTLMDTVSYADKHNEANGESNRDGHGHNLSWNNGVEGPTDDPAILAARLADVKAMLATLYFSRGVPMIQQGDELGRTQRGNNNAYAQDNEMTWVDWEHGLDDLGDFAGALNAFRDAHMALHADRFLTGVPVNGVRDVVWLGANGAELGEGDWHAEHAAILGMHLHIGGDEVLVWFNRARVPISAVCPQVADGIWQLGFASTDANAIELSAGKVMCPPRSVVALVR